MAARTLSRRVLREQHDQAEQMDQELDDTDDSPTVAEKVKKPRGRKKSVLPAGEGKAPLKPKARKKAVKVPPRMVARWAVCDGGLKRLAVFDYKDRSGADAKLVQLQEERKGTFVLQLVKDPFDHS